MMFCGNCQNDLVACKCPDFLERMESLMKPGSHIDPGTIQRYIQEWKKRRNAQHPPQMEGGR